MSEIMPNLYISDRNHVPFLYTDYDLIVNCTPDIPFPLFSNSTIRIPVYDHPRYAEKMYSEIKKTRVLEYMHRFLGTNHTVLVHCHAGIQRSCAVVACYLVEYHGLTPNEAIEHIKDKRPVAFINGVNFRETVEGVHKIREPRFPYDPSLKGKVQGKPTVFLKGGVQGERSSP